MDVKGGSWGRKGRCHWLLMEEPTQKSGTNWKKGWGVQAERLPREVGFEQKLGQRKKREPTQKSGTDWKKRREVQAERLPRKVGSEQKRGQRKKRDRLRSWRNGRRSQHWKT